MFIIWNKLINPQKPTLPTPIIKIKKELKKNSKHYLKKHEMSVKEKQLVQHIKTQTELLNINNVTRTKAYLAFYQRHPEIHWAFLAHMVSRNAGWNMTDLKGSLLSRLLTTKEQIAIFTFIERGNWLIFQDAYPQLLLYEESLKSGQNLFHLLPNFHVSLFMNTIWNYFLANQDLYILAIALIINEQSYLELRVIENSTFKKTIFNTMEFKLQDFLSMNQILFPYIEKGKVKLIGETLHHFQSLHKRIYLGKRLYSIIFNEPYRLKMLEQWADDIPHSGSRKDYWSHIFNDLDEGNPWDELKPRLRLCRLTSGTARFYSPKLEFAWKNHEHSSAEIIDWYKNWQVIYDLIDSEEKDLGEIEDEYCQTLENIELAAVAKKAFFSFIK